MAMALTDASALADAVGPALESGERDLAPLLERFEAIQRPINERIVVQSHRLARLYALRGSGWDAVKSWTIAALGSSVGTVALRGLFRTFLKSPAAAAAREMPLAGPVAS
jgi:2-polyprenyl-6-methoxyphenol hydroxylase-like FAD-dependent oxidoreductase